MKRWLTTFAAVALCSAVLGADVTVVQTTSVEGGMAAMAPPGTNTSSKMTVFVKGMKSRSEMSGGPVSMTTIVDVAAKQVIILRPDQKTATIVSPAKPPVTGTTSPDTPPVSVDAAIAPTGKSQVIDGVKCDEYTFTTTMDLSGFGGAQVPPEAAAMLQGIKMKVAGSMWVAKDVPGAAEYTAFQKASVASDTAAAVLGSAGMSMPGMDKMVKAMGSVDGLAYLSEMTINVEGSGQIADMMKQMGAMKVITRTTSISADPISDDLFKIPEGYTVVKQQP